MSILPLSPEPYRQLGVIGAGAWGTALAAVAARGGAHVKLWARDPAISDSIQQSHENPRYLPGISLPSGVHASSDLIRAVQSEALLLVVPAQQLRAQLRQLTPLISKPIPLAICAKGIEQDSGKLLTEIIAEEVSIALPAILSGPSFAHDVAKGLPTAITIAAAADIAGRLQATLGQANFRPYASDDLIGVALGGAAKNVYAIACGVVAGMGLGESARAACLARSFAELCRLGEALGARRETLMGLSGFGDLVLTATSPFSRNYAFGLALGQGNPLHEMLSPSHALAEGIATAPALVARGKKISVELPIAETVAALLDGSLTPSESVSQLMARPLGSE